MDIYNKMKPLAPETESELAAMVAGARGPLKIIGGGTRDIGAPVAGDVLSVAGLSGVKLYEPGALTLVVAAGTPLAQVDAVLAQEGQRLAFEPMDHRGLLGTEGAPSIGGVVAGNVSGPRRIAVGAARDFLLGVRFVDGMGRIIRNGGRVMKNVTGYDLVKLMAGSRGTLGVLSEVALKVMPKPPAQVMLILQGLSDQQAVEAMAAALGSPWEVTGAAHIPQQGGAQTLIRIEGFAASVTYRADRLKVLLAGYGAAGIVDDGAAVERAWQQVRDVAPLQGCAGDVWRLSLKPGDAPQIMARAGAKAAYYDWGGGLVWALTEPGTDLRARLGEFSGHATLIRADLETRQRLAVFPPEPAATAALSRGLRQKFDPRGILNPFLMGR